MMYKKARLSSVPEVEVLPSAQTDTMNSMRIIHVDCTRVEKERKNFTFKLEASWSNDKQTNLTRSYTDFFDFRNSLKETFKDRKNISIPELPALKSFERGWLFANKEAAAEKKKKAISEFCHKILKLPIDVSQSNEVFQFFEPWDGDTISIQVTNNMRPTRTADGRRFSHQVALGLLSQESSAMAAIYEDGGDIDAGAIARNRPRSGSTPEISLCPQAPTNRKTATLPRDMSPMEMVGPAIMYYRANCDYSCKKDGEVSLMEGDVVDVLDRNLSGWWFVHVERSQEEGWAPGAFLDAVTAPSEEGQSAPEEVDSGYHTIDDVMEEEGPTKYRTLMGYNAQSNDEVSYNEGEDIEVISKHFNGWWKVRCKGQEGYTAAINLIPASEYADKENAERSSKGNSKSIYVKDAPPRRSLKDRNRLKTLDPGPLYAKVDKAKKKNKGVTNGNGADETHKDSPKPRVPPGTEGLDYTEIQFDSDDEGIRRPIIRKDSAVDYAEINDVLLPHKAERKPTHNYTNIAPHSNQYENIHLKTKTKMLYNVIQDYTPNMRHVEGMAVQKGDIVMAEREEPTKIFCVMCAKDSDTSPKEGWVPRSVLEEHLGEVTSRSRHSIPIASAVAPPRPAPRARSPQPKPRRLRNHSDEEQQPNATVAEESHSSLPEILPVPQYPPPSLPKGMLKNPESPTHVPATVEAVAHSPEQREGLLPFKEGDSGTLLRRDPSGWWCVLIGNAVGWVPAEFWQLKTPAARRTTPNCLSSQPWFVGKMSRGDCEKLMTGRGRQKDFIIRESTNRVGDYTLSVFYNNRVRHFPIENTDKGRFSIGKYHFKDLKKVVDYYQAHPLFFDDQIAVSLGNPLQKVS